jgi:hypothetical protein
MGKIFFVTSHIANPGNNMPMKEEKLILKTALLMHG